MRPAISGMFDSEIRIWRPAFVRDSVGMEDTTYTPVGEVGAAINRSRAPETDVGAGHAPTGSIRWYGLPTIDVQPRDVCEVIAGPDAGRLWEVNEPPTRPRGHHTQVDCIEWNGKLPTLDES